MPEGEEKEQKIGNLSEKKMKENGPNLAKEIDMQVFDWKHRESQSSWTQRGPHQDTSKLKCQGLKIKRKSYKQQEIKLQRSKTIG